MNTFPTRNHIFLLAAFILVGGMFVAISAQQATRSTRNATTYAPGALVHGSTYAEWNARQWQWTTSFPLDANPGHDVSGDTCANGQSGPVFFLPHNFAPCTVPADTAILVPIAGTECSTREPAPFSGASEEELRNCASREVDRYINVRVTVDGQEVPDIEMYRTSSPLFTLSLPERNILGAPAGMAHAVAEGYQVILKPLPPGDHEIVVHLELADGTVLPDKLVRLTVAEPAWSVPMATPVGT